MLRAFLMLAIAVLCCSSAPVAEQAMIVLDASGSMWG
jgi:hypothetical protein